MDRITTRSVRKVSAETTATGAWASTFGLLLFVVVAGFPQIRALAGQEPPADSARQEVTASGGDGQVSSKVGRRGVVSGLAGLLGGGPRAGASAVSDPALLAEIARLKAQLAAAEAGQAAADAAFRAAQAEAARLAQADATRELFEAFSGGISGRARASNGDRRDRDAGSGGAEVDQARRLQAQMSAEERSAALRVTEKVLRFLESVGPTSSLQDLTLRWGQLSAEVSSDGSALLRTWELLRAWGYSGDVVVRLFIEEWADAQSVNLSEFLGLPKDQVAEALQLAAKRSVHFWRGAGSPDRVPPHLGIVLRYYQGPYPNKATALMESLRLSVKLVQIGLRMDQDPWRSLNPREALARRLAERLTPVWARHAIPVRVQGLLSSFVGERLMSAALGEGLFPEDWLSDPRFPYSIDAYLAAEGGGTSIAEFIRPELLTAASQALGFSQELGSRGGRTLAGILNRFPMDSRGDFTGHPVPIGDPFALRLRLGVESSIDLDPSIRALEHQQRRVFERLFPLGVQPVGGQILPQAEALEARSQRYRRRDLQVRGTAEREIGLRVGELRAWRSYYQWLSAQVENEYRNAALRGVQTQIAVVEEELRALPELLARRAQLMRIIQRTPEAQLAILTRAMDVGPRTRVESEIFTRALMDAQNVERAEVLSISPSGSGGPTPLEFTGVPPAITAKVERLIRGISAVPAAVDAFVGANPMTGATRVPELSLSEQVFDPEQLSTEIQALARMLEAPTDSVQESPSVNAAPADPRQAAAQAPTLEGATCRELFL